MNGLERTMAALRGEQPDRVPILLHNFMMAAREVGLPQSQYRSDPRNIANAFIQAVEKYDYDGILVDIDTATLAHAVGVPVDYPDDEPALCVGGCLDNLAEIAELPQPDVAHDEQIQIWLEAVRLLVQHFGGEICVRGNCDQAPFSLAGMMRTPQAWMMELLDEKNHDNVFALLAYCAEATSQFIRLMAETGAHMTSNGDGSAGPDVVSPRMYREYALPYEKKVAQEAHAVGLPYVLHICGDATPILGDILETGADGIELDYKTDMNRAHDVLKGKMCFVGNIDPSGVLALGTVDDVERETAKLLAVFADTPGFILNAGCAIPPNT
ncbi:MAG: uroporphyrinogen decarboxylase family protein, partial [Pirellulaceae bacterium]